MRIVLDTNVLIRAHQKSKALARRLLDTLIEHKHRLVVSNEMVVETTRVLRYPRFKQAYGFTDAELLEYAQFLQSVGDLVVLDANYRAVVLRDASDLMVLQTAERGEADILCTHDDDFYDEEILAFCSQRGIEICDEATLLARLLQQ